MVRPSLRPVLNLRILRSAWTRVNEISPTAAEPDPPGLLMVCRPRTAAAGGRLQAGLEDVRRVVTTFSEDRTEPLS